MRVLISISFGFSGLRRCPNEAARDCVRPLKVTRSLTAISLEAPLAMRVREAFMPIAYARAIEAAWRNLPLLNGRAFESPAACPDQRNARRRQVSWRDRSISTYRGLALTRRGLSLFGRKERPEAARICRIADAVIASLHRIRKHGSRALDHAACRT